jgi:short-subunit dehydrogenase
VLLAFLDAHGLRPNLLINNAGHGRLRQFCQFIDGKNPTQIELNITALTMLTRMLLETAEAGTTGGRAEREFAGQHTADAGSGGVCGIESLCDEFFRGAGVELAPQNITVTCVCPGPTPTNFSKTAKREDGSDTNREGPGLLRIPPQRWWRRRWRPCSRAGHACFQARALPSPRSSSA